MQNKVYFEQAVQSESTKVIDVSEKTTQKLLQQIVTTRDIIKDYCESLSVRVRSNMKPVGDKAQTNVNLSGADRRHIKKVEQQIIQQSKKLQELRTSISQQARIQVQLTIHARLLEDQISQQLLLSYRNLFQSYQEIDMGTIKETRAKITQLSKAFILQQNQYQDLWQNLRVQMSILQQDLQRLIANIYNCPGNINSSFCKAMVSPHADNGEFYSLVLDQFEKMEKITCLDDSKKIKKVLIHELNQMREIVKLRELVKNQDRRKVKLLACQVQRLHKELAKTRAKSMTDGLTGVYNRNAFDDSLKDLIQHSRVTNTSFSLLLLDLDDFKHINDTHGHLIGDQVLTTFTKKCRALIRWEDCLARYGGDEFAILLPGVNLNNSIKKGRQICQAVATTTEYSDKYLRINVRIGVAVFNNEDTCEMIIDRADKALYMAKRSGKNQVVGRKS